MTAADFKTPAGLLRPEQFTENNIDTLLGAWLLQVADQLNFHAQNFTPSTEPTMLEGTVYPNETDALTAAYVYWRAFDYLCQRTSERPVSISAGSTSVRYDDASVSSYCKLATTYRQAWFNGTGQSDLIAVY